MIEPSRRGGTAGGAGPAYDYVLAVGPSRSGTTFLYRLLIAHPAFCAPEIKEAHYYRSARRLERALGRLRGSDAMLLDIADTAWSDRRLVEVAARAGQGRRILVVVLLRRHRDRARSTMAYRKSRVIPTLPAWFAGPGGLERAVERDGLTAAALERIFALGADVLTIEFKALTGETQTVLNTVARLCRTQPFEIVAAAPVNRAERARFPPLAAAAKLAAWALRTLGARRLLQALKDDPRVVGLVFRPLDPEELPALSAAAAERLERQHSACRAAIEAASEPLGEGLWLARAAPGGRPASPPAA